jgi:Zn finger protein HypA/HybF involved in hydrogenase expression
MAPLRPTTKCPCCGIKLISPAWSKSMSASEITNYWRCPICGSKFETVDAVITTTTTDDVNLSENLFQSEVG